MVKTGLLSSLQLESVYYACQTHERFTPSNSRYGFFVGDGPGVGKGRQVAAIIVENYLRYNLAFIFRGRRRSIWFSVSNDLIEDSIRDLADLGFPNFPVKF